ncbi:indole-3-glycerol phosphate synthase TrpC [Limisalsivibrio acetivorans]|uniref:indole-3-glycerol phosphate synthase TrpC n=1 Tax=Limisalsivibrio acetivorans TaxID=1304888 RepID=UPI0003B43115|nr:indole-3-glycerol phosphate synthase TrpC [Limisalsivibrio acetivorans]
MLDEILAHKREEIKGMTLIDSKRMKPVIDAVASLRQKPIIAEVKKASPSLGNINIGADPVAQAKLYESCGAGMVSVLTDKKYFSGDMQYLADIAASVEIPVLCKDFILSEVQIENAYRSGADCILLMATVLNRDEIERLAKYARERGLEILFEIHALSEMERLTGVEPALLGVNSRNLKNLEIDLNVGAGVLKALEGNYIKVAESGMKTPVDVAFMKDAGADAFLIGSGLMAAENTEELLGSMLEAACS